MLFADFLRVIKQNSLQCKVLLHIVQLFLFLECDVGYIRDAKSDECVACPQGTYSDTIDGITCTSCPEGTTTSNDGSPLPENCVGNENYSTNGSNF